ncbi:MAG TPA: 2'-5' RNA ligase family protein [Streptosporangiaceae bacterium]|nr:2'-5' RNA ligase family protein [Streptosporangiaceae bacterium]
MSGTTERMRNHWWWRPGWRVGRRMYTWHFTFDNQTALHELVDAYQGRLAGLPRMDSIPREWLHLTTQGVGFTDEVSDAELEAVIDASRKRLAAVPRVTVSMGPAIVDPEVVRLEVRPASALMPVRCALRDAITAARGPEQAGESGDWTPHVSVAYSNSDGPVEPYLTAIDPPLEPVSVEITDVQLIVLGRDTHLYEWETRAVVPLA